VPVFSCGRSLYIDLHTVVVVGGNVLYHVKREGELSGREGKMSRGEFPILSRVTCINEARNSG